MRLVALQSNYIPWKGYFDLLKTADLFVVYDSVQFTKNDWRNRNVIVGPNGPIWLSIPVQTAGRPTQRISEVYVTDSRWARKHWTTVVQTLGKRPHFARYHQEWEAWFTEAAQLSLLHDINLVFLRGAASQLSITTPIVDDTEFDLGPGSATERLVALCQLTGATTYVTGPAGLDYMNLDVFRDAALDVEVIDYGDYPVYRQLTDPFTHGVSVLDLLANVGPEASSHLLQRTSRVA